ncbi:MAG: isochorismatase family protein [Puniceicoccales bacterium]|jgi:nicotinamidase-related amidase/type 1 glutamine amidotransferase|nr:isochorismatase family protein [Puniceicoccales bacterium]
MKIAPFLGKLFTAAFLVAVTPFVATAANDSKATLRVTLQDRVPFSTQLKEEAVKLKTLADSSTNKKAAAALRREAKRLEADAAKIEDSAISVRNRVEQWVPSETAIVICDMWNKHWCKHATARVGELAPALNEVITIAREKGISIVHAPSETLGFYKDHPARKKAEKYQVRARDRWAHQLPTERGAKWPVDAGRNGGCPECKQGRAWSRQIDTITIKDEDIVSDNGHEIRGYFKEKGIKNVILTGVHTNMCVIGRPFGLRAMKSSGFNVVLLRDMTDLMYNNVISKPIESPKVTHFSGLDLMVEYIETYVTPSIVSSDFTGKKQFRFKEDVRPRVAFLTAESEYRASQRLHEFGHELTLKEIRADYATGNPIMEGPGRHNLENLQILEDANLAVFFIRRRALEPEKMAQIKSYIASGRPVLGIRTASHAFDAKGNVPRSGGGIVAAKEKTSNLLAQWPEFDKTVLGGNYKGHYGHLKTGTDVYIVPGQEKHPILEGVDPAFNSPNWLYKNTPLRTKKATVLLKGKNPGVPDEPVFWINEAGKGKVIYTSLGHWDDWKIDSFKKLMFNTVNYLLKEGAKTKN